MPRAKVSTATAVNTGFVTGTRAVYRRSRAISPIWVTSRRSSLLLDEESGKKFDVKSRQDPELSRGSARASHPPTVTDNGLLTTDSGPGTTDD